MKILVLPLLLILLPIGILWLILKYLPKKQAITTGMKIALGFIFIAAGLVSTFYAMLISLDGMSDKNIKCANGVIVFIYFGLVIYMAAVPLLLFSHKPKKLNAA